MSMAREELADRVRSLLPRGVHCIEKRMFGGIAFMAHGNMMIVPLKDGTLLVRVGKDGMEDAVAQSGASIMEMSGRSMGGAVVVSGDAIEDDEALSAWIERSWRFVKTLPAK